MEKSAEAISAFSSNHELTDVPICAPEELAPEVRELGFGQYLRRERLLRGITREEVLRVTKVSDSYLRALETNQFDELPERAYVVGFLKVLSDYAGLEKDEIVNRFLTERAQQEAYEEGNRQQLGFWKRHLRTILGTLGAISILVLIFAPLFRG